MDIILREITVKDLVEGYMDHGENGVRGYGGKLDIRPKFQREFVYKDKQRDAVIDTITKGFPLNVMYWADRGDGTYEIIDGQQRTISIAQYVEGDFSYDNLYFHNLPPDKREHLLEYKLMIYVCNGTDSEKLEWFKTINIAGEELTVQELRNAVYSGSWVSDAKRYFSKPGCVAYKIGSDYMSGNPIRQDYLQTVISWASNDNIEDYMGTHQHEPSASELWEYYQVVMDWVASTFAVKRTTMKGVNWGELHRQHHQTELDPQEIENEIQELMLDDEVTKKGGIYPYVLTRQEHHLNLRAFSPAIKIQTYEKQSGVCPVCGQHFEQSEMEADHITPWIEGGKTVEDNCQMLCKEDNRRKGAR